MSQTLSRIAAIAAVLLAACAESERITSPSNETLVVRDAKAVAGAPYSVTDLGVYPGDKESFGWAVNNNGSVVIDSRAYPSTGGITGHWYVKTGSILHTLSYGGALRAISSGPTAYVVGSTDAGVRWAYSTTTGFSEPVALVPRGYGRSINDAGDIAGDGGTNAGDVGIWKLDGNTLVIPNYNPSLYVYSEARGINDAGDVAISYKVYGSLGPDRGYVRTADGVMIELPPLAGHNSTYVRGISEPIDGVLYAGGTSDDDNGNYNAVRWKIDIGSHTVTETAAAASGTNGLAMSDDGTLAGNVEGPSTSAWVWKVGGSVASLKTPKGLGNGRVWGISSNGRYIAGDGKSGGYRRAVLWTAQ